MKPVHWHLPIQMFSLQILTGQAITTESVPHHARWSGGDSDWVENSDKFFVKSETQTTRRPSSVKAATNWPFGATASRVTTPFLEAATCTVSVSATRMESPYARSTYENPYKVRSDVLEKENCNRPVFPRDVSLQESPMEYSECFHKKS